MAASKLQKIITSQLINGYGDRIPVESLCGKGKFIGLFFSGHWCPPCRIFTPVLKEFYHLVHEMKQLEIIFVSSDRSEVDFKKYFATMPWLAIEFTEAPCRERIMLEYGIRGIPCLTILDGETGEVIVQNGRKAVTSDKSGEKFPWKGTSFS